MMREASPQLAAPVRLPVAGRVYPAHPFSYSRGLSLLQVSDLRHPAHCQRAGGGRATSISASSVHPYTPERKIFAN